MRAKQKENKTLEKRMSQISSTNQKGETNIDNTYNPICYMLLGKVWKLLHVSTFVCEAGNKEACFFLLNLFCMFICKVDCYSLNFY